MLTQQFVLNETCKKVRRSKLRIRIAKKQYPETEMYVNQKEFSLLTLQKDVFYVPRHTSDQNIYYAEDLTSLDNVIFCYLKTLQQVPN